MTSDPAARPVLVVVADDAGVDVARNRGIVTACEQGVVRAISVLATGKALGDLAERLADLPTECLPDLGLHLNLTEGRALSGAIDGVTDTHGRFCGDKSVLWDRALAGAIDAEGISREVLAQIARLDDAGFPPSRIDGHQHVHVLPGVRDGIALAVRESPAITWTRLGCPVMSGVPDPEAFPCLATERVGEPWRALHDSGRVATAALGTLHEECDALREAGLRSTAVFAGTRLLSDPTLDACLAEVAAAVALAREMGADTIELMTHPGDCDPESVAFSADASRRTEMRLLCDPEIVHQLESTGVRLGRFADLGPAS